MSQQQVIHLLINQEEVKTPSYMEVRDPGRLTDVVGNVAIGSVAHVDQAVRAAHQAFQSWKTVAVEERCRLLLRAAELIQSEGEAVARLLTKEAGMLLSVYRGEVGMAINVLKATTEWAQTFFSPKQVEDGQSWVSLEKRPLGVIAAIVPWNLPLMLTMQKLAAILVTGNTIVIKPSPFAAIGVSVVLKKIAAMFPPGVINVIHGEAEVGSALSTHPLVRKISFTGGGKTAQFVMRDAADSLKHVQFELGGNDPAIVLDDANVDEVMPQIAAAAFRRSGQICVATKRVYVPKQYYERACELVCAYADQFSIGHGLDEKATFSPVNNRIQYQFVKELLERTRQSNARVMELGTRLEPENWENGYYLHPTVVMYPDPGQEIVTCEQFGPVLPIVPYHTEEEAIQWANSTEYGLGSSIWSSDPERALRVARHIEAGMTCINGANLSPLGLKHVPFGGVKQSGIGREKTEVGLAEFIEYHGINYHKETS